MNNEMSIIEPVAMTDAPHTRASQGTYWTHDGTVQTALVNVLRVTYDPTNLAAPPYVLLEDAAVNLFRNTAAFDTEGWTVSGATYGGGLDLIPYEGPGTAYASQVVTLEADKTYTFWADVLPQEITECALAIDGNIAYFDLAAGTAGTATGLTSTITALPNGQYRCAVTYTNGSATSATAYLYVAQNGSTAITAGVWDTLTFLRMQFELGTVPTSFIVSGASPGARAADVFGTTGTVVHSNVPEVYVPYDANEMLIAGEQRLLDHQLYESKVGVRGTVTMTIAAPGVVTWTAHGHAVDTPLRFDTTGALPSPLVAGTTYYVRAPAANTFNLAATPGGAAITTTGTQSGTHTCTASANVNKPVTDETIWLPLGYTNRWKMVDPSNSSQTEYDGVIHLVLAPRRLVHGLYVGNADSDDIRVTVQDLASGIVLQTTRSMLVEDSGSSFYRWCFNRVERKSAALVQGLPPFANPIVTISLHKRSGPVKCGLVVIGPEFGIGLPQYGLGQDIKDYSSNVFKFDGTFKTTPRDYVKRMSLDVQIDNNKIDAVNLRLARWRQTQVLWIGSPLYDSAIIFGKFSSFKNIIKNYSSSMMALQIDGTV